MAYCAESDVQMAAGGSTRLRQLSDWENEGDVDSDVVASMISSADAWINEYLQKRHEVALEEPIPDGIRDVSAEHAVFLMKERRDMVTEKDMQMFEHRMKRLDDIAKGVRTVGVNPLPAKSQLVVDNQSDRPTDKEVSRSTTKGFW